MREDFIQLSLDANLFFARIMKEHALFLAVATPQKYSQVHIALEKQRVRFDNLLSDVLEMSAGMLPEDISFSGIITANTQAAETVTQTLVGHYINTQLTARTMQVINTPQRSPSNAQLTHYYEQCQEINKRAIQFAQDFEQYKEQLFLAVTEGQLFIALFPSVLRHMALEAQLYAQQIATLSAHEEVEQAHNTQFWVARSKEHAIVTQSWLDPSESAKRQEAHEFFEFFSEAEADHAQNTELVDKNLQAFANYNGALVYSMLEHKLLSQMLPLFSDHLERESLRGI